MIGSQGSYIIIDNDRVNTLIENKDDVITQTVNDNQNIIEKLKQYPQYEQKSKEWFEQRKHRIGGSESACVLDMNHFEPQYNFIKKKISDVPFVMNFKNLYWGNATEMAAIHLYEYLYNVSIDEYGFLPHETLSFIGASPDGIVGKYKRNKQNLTNLCGRMVEIKSVATRKINMDPNDTIINSIIPEYYIPQIYQQLETCNLNECDFFQIKAIEYDGWNDFKEDTNIDKPYLTKDNKFKNMIIQLLPNYIKSDAKGNKIYQNAKFIHPPKIDMTITELLRWYRNVKKQQIPQGKSLSQFYTIRDNYYIHKVIYYYIDHARCTLVNRNKTFFTSNIPIYTKMWNYVIFLRNNHEHAKIFLNLLNYYENEVMGHKINKKELNKRIFNFLDQIIEIKEINISALEKLCEKYGDSKIVDHLVS